MKFLFMIKDELRGNEFCVGDSNGYKMRMRRDEADKFISERMSITADNAAWSDLELAVISVVDEHQQNCTGVKDDSEKYFASLIDDFSLALVEIAKAATYGARKYSRDNWKSVDNAIVRYHDAEWRHRLAGGGDYAAVDDESGLHHKAHELWNALASYTLFLKKEMKK